MREFFKGWRPKVGCIALAMACLFAMGWVRSYDYDWFEVFGLRISSDEGFFGPSRIVKVEHGPVIVPEHQIFLSIPYWLVVWPLTLLSAYLILWKPPHAARQIEQDSSSEICNL